MVIILLSTLLTFAATSLFVYWVLAQARGNYAEGLRRAEGYLVDTSDPVDPGSLLGYASRFGLVFLPLNERMRDAGTLGVADALARWEAMLVRAGLRSRITPEQFLGMCQVAAAVGAIVATLLLATFGLGIVSAAILGVLVGGFLGFVVPVYLLSTAAAERVARIEKRLPFAIEFMLLAMEATAALPEAIAVYRDQFPGDPLADEFGLVLADIRRGSSQIDALKAMGDRVASDALSAFLLAVNIGLDTGQPIKAVLQTQSDATRTRRYQAAEEVAKTAGTKAILPLFIVVIGILMLLLGPIAIKAIQGGVF